MNDGDLEMKAYAAMLIRHISYITILYGTATMCSSTFRSEAIEI